VYGVANLWRIDGKDGVAGSIPAGARPQHRRSGRVRHRPVAGLSAVNHRLPEICQIDLITLSRYAVEELDAVDLAAPAGPCPGSPSLIRGRTTRTEVSRSSQNRGPEQARPLQAPAVGGPRARHPPRHPLAVPPCPAGLHSHCWPAVPSVLLGVGHHRPSPCACEDAACGLQSVAVSL
jgi:hypothetical protein